MFREELDLLRRLIDGSPIPTFVLSSDHTILYWNRALEELSKIKAEEVIGTREHWRAFYSKKRPCLADLLLDDAHDEIPRWYEGKFLKSPLIEEAYEATDFFPDLGTTGKWLRFTAALIRDPQGRKIGAIETLEDISAKKEAEAALIQAREELESRVVERTRQLAEANETLSLILQSLPLVVYTRQASGNYNFTYIGKNVEEITGYSPSDFLENVDLWRTLLHPDDRVTAIQNLQKKKDKRIRISQYRFQARDGTYRWFSDFWRFVEIPGTKSMQIVGVWQDVTEEKKMRQEAELRLQQMIQTHKLTALGEVVAGVVHEINNPMSFISYNIPLLEEIWKIVVPLISNISGDHPQLKERGFSVKEICEQMEEIIHAFRMGTARINRVISGLKEFSRADDQVSMRLLSVEELIEGALIITGSQLRKRVSELKTEVEPNLPKIHGHLQKLEQVLTNLLINAYQSIPGGKRGRINVRARLVERLGALVIEVEDNGEGMSRDVMDRLFVPFFTTRRDSGGTGLGLSISYGLIQEHGGIIGVMSRLNYGSRFSIFLPLDKNIRFKLSPAILCIDSDSTFLETLRAHLPNVLVLPAANIDRAETVVHLLKDYPEVDWVIANVDLPLIDGGQLLRALREDFPLLNVIAFAEKGKYGRVPEDLKGFVDFFLEKSLVVDHADRIINEVGRQRL